MITVLERQHVSKRAPSPVAIRARSIGVTWSNGDLAALSRKQAIRQAEKAPSLRKHPPPGRRAPAEHSFLQGQLIQGKKRRAARKARKLMPRGTALNKPARRAAGRLGTALFGALHSPWLFIGIAAAAAMLLTVSAVFPGASLSLPIKELTFAQARPALPAPSDVDPILYRLLVPEETQKSSSAVNPVLLTSLKVSQYKTQTGDTLSKIASRFKLNIDTVVSWNDIHDAHSIPAGTVLAIPNSDGLKYTVRRGDTLQGIARSSGVDFNGILDKNVLANSLITVGQELFLPGARMNPTDLNRILGSLFIYPVQGRISSYFGERADPFTGVPNFHNGVDIVNKPGTAIDAAMAGRVADVGFNFDYGNYVILQHSGGYQTLYGHMTRYIVGRGQKVQQGQEIGELGTTGYSTGPHVHFSIFHDGKPVDPMRFLK